MLPRNVDNITVEQLQYTKSDDDLKNIGTMHLVYHKIILASHHVSRFNLFGLINKQCTLHSVYVCSSARKQHHRMGSQAP